MQTLHPSFSACKLTAGARMQTLHPSFSACKLAGGARMQNFAS